MNKFFYKIYTTISIRTFWIQDRLTDYRICGQSLTRYVLSVFRDDANGVGMTGHESTSR